MERAYESDGEAEGKETGEERKRETWRSRSSQEMGVIYVAVSKKRKRETEMMKEGTRKP
jgi:hypothetical protein